MRWSRESIMRRLRLMNPLWFYEVDPTGWSFHLFGFALCKFGPKYAKNGKKYSLHGRGMLWRF